MDSERPPGTKPTAADVADARLLNLEPRTLRTKFGGLFLFLPALADLEFDRIVGFEDSVNFFHVDSLSSAVALKVHCDLQLTLMASSLYRHFGQNVGHGYEKAESRHIFRDFIDATATIDISEAAIDVVFQKRAHNSLLVAAGFDKIDKRIPWIGKRVRFQFG